MKVRVTSTLHHGRRGSPGQQFLVAIACVGVYALVSGCASFSTYKDPKPLSKGSTQVFISLQSDASGPKETGMAPFPELGLSMRYGITDRFEIAGNLVGLYMGEAMTLGGYEAVGKFHLYGKPGRLDLAVGGGAGYRVYRTSGAVLEMVHASIPFSFGLQLGEKHQIILSPALTFQRWYSDGTMPVNVFAAGGSVGYRYQISERFAIFPEFSLFRDIDGSLDNFDQRGLIHAGIALVFGKR